MKVGGGPSREIITSTESKECADVIKLDPLSMLVLDLFIKISKEFSLNDMRNCFQVCRQWLTALDQGDKNEVARLLRVIEKVKGIINIHISPLLQLLNTYQQSNMICLATDPHYLNLLHVLKSKEYSILTTELSVTKLKECKRGQRKIFLSKSLVDLFNSYLGIRFGQNDVLAALKECLRICEIEAPELDTLPSLKDQFDFVFALLIEENHFEIALALLVFATWSVHIPETTLPVIFEKMARIKGLPFVLDVIRVCCTCDCVDQPNFMWGRLVKFFIKWFADRLGETSSDYNICSNQVIECINEIYRGEIGQFLDSALHVPIGLPPGVWTLVCEWEKVRDPHTSYTTVLEGILGRNFGEESFAKLILEPTEEFKELPDLLVNWLELDPKNFLYPIFDELAGEEHGDSCIEEWFGICKKLLYAKKKEQTFEEIHELLIQEYIAYDLSVPSYLDRESNEEAEILPPDLSETNLQLPE